MGDLEIHSEIEYDVDGLAVQAAGFKRPLSQRLECGGVQLRIGRLHEQVDGADAAFAGDDAAQDDEDVRSAAPMAPRADSGNCGSTRRLTIDAVTSPPARCKVEGEAEHQGRFRHQAGEYKEGAAMLIRPIRRDDRDSWLRMRDALWPSPAREHAVEIDRYFAGEVREPLEVLIAFDEDAIGFIELSIRASAEGCETDRVAFVEGWYVDPDARGTGVGAALIRAAEEWARSQGCTELASDSEVDDGASAAAHVAVGFEEAAVVRCFRKSLS
jgi:aminoglycoside 6'-N-acetyltransferase I